MRSMAILCILLGPLLALTAISSFLVKRVMDWADRHGVPSPMGELSAVLIDFSVKTAWVLVPLGALITVAGIRGTREPRQGRRWLAFAAWLTTGTMVLLSMIWSWSLHGTRWDTLDGHLLGWGSHLANGVLTLVAARFLSSEALRRACEASA
ncbi:MAG: hypothetical protein U1E65_08070 [Myxococcota bacterium]